MKTFSIVLAILFTSIATNSFGQANNADCDSSSDCCQQSQKAATPTITKGYYAIGNNSKKLAKTKSCCIHASAQSIKRQRAVTKGYYATGNNNEKLAVNNNELAGDSQSTNVSKGYYAIGNNSSKLVSGKANCCCR